MDILDMLIINGTIVTDTESYPGTIGIKDGRTAFIGEPEMRPMAVQTVDVRGNYILPGAIDPHVHFQDPGFTEREDFEHGTMAAASGGMTCVLSHPLDNPPTTTFENLKIKEKAYEGKAYVDYGIHIGATSDNLDVLPALWNQTGTTAIKMFMCFSVKEFPFVEDAAMLEVLTIVAQNDGLAMIHAENDGMLSLMTRKIQETGRKDGMAYNMTHPAEAEIEAIQRALYFLEITGARGVILHVSTARGLELIHEAKMRGVRVYAESAPHLFQFSAEDMKEKGPYLKFSPVMHDKANQKRMWQLLEKGYVDYIGSDHSPYTKEEKRIGERDIWKAPNGIPGIETSLAVFLNGVNEGRLTLNQLVKMTSKNTASIYGLAPEKGSIIPGADGDFTIVDMNMEKSITSEELKSKCKWSPYEGIVLRGWPVMTIVRGEIIYNHGRITGEAGYGKYMHRKKKDL